MTQIQANPGRAGRNGAFSTMKMLDLGSVGSYNMVNWVGGAAQARRLRVKEQAMCPDGVGWS